MVKAGGVDWLGALQKQKLEVRSANEGLVVHGWLDTGNYALNWAISGQLLGGYPLGHTVEVFGDPSTGKSFLLGRVLAMAQAAGGVALLDDVERSYNLPHMRTLGIDTDTLAYLHSRTVKDHLVVATSFIAACRSKKFAPAVLACDSLAQLSTEHELAQRLDKRDMTKAAELKAFFRIIAGELADLPAVHISANHTIAAIGSMFQKSTTPGGGGPKFAASVRIDLRSISRLKVGAAYEGAICRAHIDKNRISTPWREVRLAIPFNRPVSRASGLLPLLVRLGVLEEKGHFLYRDGDRVGRAYKSKDAFLKADALAEELASDAQFLTEVDAMIAIGREAEADNDGEGDDDGDDGE